MAAWLTVKDIHLLNAMVAVGPQLDRDIKRAVKRRVRYLKEKEAKRVRVMAIAQSLTPTGLPVASWPTLLHSPPLS
jgi:hypothetical protein